MLDLSDPRWAGLTGGYRRPYDPRPALQQLRVNPVAESAWDELWSELHHQGDLGDASYASVPVLVEIFDAAPRSWRFYALLACIELERRRRSNPPVPTWIESSYNEAWAIAQRHALSDLATTKEPLLVKSALAVVAFGAGQIRLGALLFELDESELDELLEDRLAWSELYWVAV